MSKVPVNAPSNCPGTNSTKAGKTDMCKSCPNQSTCALGAMSDSKQDIEDISKALKGVKNVCIILSGKGGVGKSSITSNLAFELSQDKNLDIGVLDLDICGSSLPRYMGVQNCEVRRTVEGWTPVCVSDNISLMSVGFLLSSPDQALIWNGNRKNGMILSFLKQVQWGSLDYLLIDTPPGTSDEHLSITNYLSKININFGAIVVTTPQELSIQDVRRQITFCNRVNLKLIGIVENMSQFNCPQCKVISYVFPMTSGGADKLAKDTNNIVLAKIPLEPKLARLTDEGKFVNENCESISEIFTKLCDDQLEKWTYRESDSQHEFHRII